MNRPMLTDALLHVDGRLATLTLNRHDVRNALTGTRLIDDIVTVADWVNRADAVSEIMAGELRMVKPGFLRAITGVALTFLPVV